jgi:hypothetical protein
VRRVALAGLLVNIPHVLDQVATFNLTSLVGVVLFNVQCSVRVNVKNVVVRRLPATAVAYGPIAHVYNNQISASLCSSKLVYCI